MKIISNTDIVLNVGDTEDIIISELSDTDVLTTAISADTKVSVSAFVYELQEDGTYNATATVTGLDANLVKTIITITDSTTSSSVTVKVKVDAGITITQLDTDGSTSGQTTVFERQSVLSDNQQALANGVNSLKSAINFVRNLLGTIEAATAGLEVVIAAMQKATLKKIDDKTKEIKDSVGSSGKNTANFGNPNNQG